MFKLISKSTCRKVYRFLNVGKMQRFVLGSLNYIELCSGGSV